jgi:hypothetical protein
MEIDWRRLRNLLLIFGLIFIGGGIYVAASAGMFGNTIDSHDIIVMRALALASTGWDLGLLILGSCSIVTALILHGKVKEEEMPS